MEQYLVLSWSEVELAIRSITAGRELLQSRFSRNLIYRVIKFYSAFHKQNHGWKNQPENGKNTACGR